MPPMDPQAQSMNGVNAAVAAWTAADASGGNATPGACGANAAICAMPLRLVRTVNSRLCCIPSAWRPQVQVWRAPGAPEVCRRSPMALECRHLLHSPLKHTRHVMPPFAPVESTAGSAATRTRPPMAVMAPFAAMAAGKVTAAFNPAIRTSPTAAQESMPPQAATASTAATALMPHLAPKAAAAIGVIGAWCAYGGIFALGGNATSCAIVHSATFSDCWAWRGGGAPAAGYVNGYRLRWTVRNPLRRRGAVLPDSKEERSGSCRHES